MINTDPFESSLGTLGVTTTNNRGHSVEEVAAMATERLVSISDTAPEPIKAQAHVFKNATKKVISYYMNEAVKNHICTICNQLEQQGHKDLANIIRRL
jgi:adenylate kinase family enzyme